MDPTVSVIVPAFNEEACLAATLDCLRAAARELAARHGIAAEIIVVDNASTDGTASIAVRSGARVVSEPVHNIGRVRNAGAQARAADVMVFVDADTLVPVDALARIWEEMRDARCAGGALDLRYRPRRRVMAWYLAGWRWFARMASACGAQMAMGAGQFCRRELFGVLGGYDETIHMGEDIDFFWRLQRLARRRRMRVALVRDVVVTPSSRRFDQWPLWRVLLWTNPIFIWPLRRRRAPWGGWYSRPVR